MYWDGDTEYLAFGCGAASYVDKVRFSRPKTLKNYYRYVDSITQSYKKEIDSIA